MDWTFPFFRLDGRINRAKYWIGSLAIGAAGIVAMLLIGWAVGLSDASVKFAIAVALALMYPTYAVMAKRFQDRNRPGALALFGIVPLILSNLLYTFDVFDADIPTMVSQVFDLALVGISIWLLIDLGILKGTQGPTVTAPIRSAIRQPMPRSPRCSSHNSFSASVAASRVFING